MKKVLHASDLFEDKKEEKALKPIDFTHYLRGDMGFSAAQMKPVEFDKIIYLGYCNEDGDMFAAYVDGVIRIYKGHLNDGIIK